MEQMISIVIRNKNESENLKRLFSVLISQYAAEIDEIIVVDNNSTDDSVAVALKYNCKVITIDTFTYGKASNLGVKEARNKYVLLLSAHAIPIGNNFFLNSIEFVLDKKDFAGLRYINSIENYERALRNNFIIKDPLKYGLMAACCLISKDVWSEFPFNEELVFSEDKEWSQRVTNSGFTIYEMNESFFYFIKRTTKSKLDRYENETIANYKLFNNKYPSQIKIMGSFIYKILVTNNVNYIKLLINDVKITIMKFRINRFLNPK